MLGILRGSLVTAVCGIAGDFSDDAKVKLRRTINEEGHSFCQYRAWPFLASVVTFNITDGTTSYAGSGYLPYTFQRFIAIKIKDSNNNYVPIEEKSLGWYEEIQDPAFEGQPFAVVLRGLDSNGYPKAYFYYTPDATYTFEADVSLDWTDVAEAASGDATRVVITQDCFPAFKWWVAKAYGVLQGDDNLIARCNTKLFGDRLQRVPGAMALVISKQRGAKKRGQMMPDGSYKGENYITSSDYGRKVP